MLIFRPLKRDNTEAPEDAQKAAFIKWASHTPPLHYGALASFLDSESPAHWDREWPHHRNADAMVQRLKAEGMIEKASPARGWLLTDKGRNLRRALIAQEEG